MVFAVTVFEVATPKAFETAVFEVVKVALAPEFGAENVTVAPLTTFPPTSVTVTLSGLAKAVPIAVLCGVPLTTVTLLAAPGLFVSAKLAPVAAPEAAVTLYVPVTVLAVNAADVATPEALVVAVTTPPAKLPPAPFTGTTVKVTVAPDTKFWLASLTVACKGLVNAVPTAVF